MRILKPKEVAERLNVTVWTLQQWDKAGKLKAKRTSHTNRRYYTEEAINEFLGVKRLAKDAKVIIYCRVSNVGQKDDLKNQTEFLRTFCNARGVIVDEVLTDIGSGLNYSRKHFNAIIDKAVKGSVKQLYITHKDRLTRFGYEWFEDLLKKNGCEIIVVNNETLSPQEEMIQDLISIIHVFSCRIHGLHKYKKKIREDMKHESL